MPSITAGTGVSSSSQLGTGVVTTTAILDDTVAATDIATGGVATGEILDGTIANIDISASAAIVDTKLATISTAGKVSGAAITSLASIPAGAGTIPSANLPSLGSRITSDASNQTVTHPGNGVATTLYTLAVPANTLSTGNTIRGRLYISSEGWATGGTNTIDFKYNNSTFLSYSIAGATMTTGWLSFELTADGSTSAQYASGIGAWPTIVSALGTCAQDSTQALNITVVFTPSASNPGDTVTFGGITLNKDA